MEAEVITSMIIILITLWIVLLTIFDLLFDRKVNKDIEELRLALDELEKIESEPFDEELPPNVRIIRLKQRLKHLVFCSQCPYYLTEDQENMRA